MVRRSKGINNAKRRSKPIPKPWENKSGCKDPTAYEAINNVEEEEQRVADFIRAMKSLAKLCGFEITSWITIKVKKSGRTY